MLESLVQHITIPSEVLHNRIIYRFEFCLVQNRSIRTVHIQLLDHTRRCRVTTHMQTFLTDRYRLFRRRSCRLLSFRGTYLRLIIVRQFLLLLILLHLRFRNIEDVVLPGIGQLTDNIDTSLTTSGRSYN